MQSLAVITRRGGTGVNKLMRARNLLAILFLAVIPANAAAQLEPTIELDPAIECWYHSDFPMLSANVDPLAEIVRSRLYFRCSSFQDYYFVDLSSDAGTFTGVAPQADESCPRVHYYVEAVTRDYTSARTEERIAEVTSTSECRRRNPAAMFFPGDDPGIVLGSTVSGPQLAPGFKSIGISGFISSTGAVASTTGGSSTAIVAGGVAAGAGVAALALLSGGDDPPPPVPFSGPPVALPPPPVVPPPTPGTGGPRQDVKACVRFDPIDAQVEVNEPLTIDARCSEGGPLDITIELGDGRVRTGQAFLTVVWPVAGDYTMVLTVRRAGTTTSQGARLLDEDTLTRRVRVAPVLQPVAAEFNFFPLGENGPCAARYDARPTTGDAASYDWVIDVNGNQLGFPISLSGQIVQHNFQECSRSTPFDVRLTVTGLDGSESTITKEVCLIEGELESCHQYEGTFSRRSQEVTFTSELSLPGGTPVQAQILMPGGGSAPIRSSGPAQHRYRARAGRQVLEAFVQSSIGRPALWRFDFSKSRIVPGSLRVVAGNEVSRGAGSVAVRISGEAGERVRLEYEIAR